MAKSSKKQKGPEPAAKQTKKQIAISRKEARQNRIILIAIIALALIIVSILAVGIIQELIIRPGRAVATVNGANIREDDYQDLLTYNRYNQYVTISNLQTALDELQASPDDNQFLISFYEQQLQQLQSSVALLPQDTLDEMIDDQLVRQKAEEEGLTVTTEEIEQSITDDLTRALSPAAQEPLTDTQQLPTPTWVI
jgi:uncharacterized membrane protein YvbJ